MNSNPKKNDRRRAERVEREVLQTIAGFLINGLRAELPGIVTVSRVMMPGDLRTAKVYVSSLDGEKATEEAADILQQRAFEIQRHINEKLSLRFCPKLKFFPDESTAHVLKVESILKEIKSKTPHSDS